MSNQQLLQNVLRFVLIISVVSIVVLVVVLFGRIVLASLLPFFIAFVLAGLIEPAVRRFESIRIPRAPAIVAVLICVVLVGGYAFVWLFGRVLAEMVQLASAMTVYGRELLSQIDQLFVRFEDFDALMPENIQAEVQRRLEDTVINLIESGQEALTALANGVLGRIAGLPSVMVVTVVAVVATFFLSRDRQIVWSAVIRLAPEKWRAPLSDAQEKILVDLIGFLKGQLFLLVLTTALTGFGLWAVGSPYWLSMALVAGFLDLVPILGPGLLFFPWAVGAFLIGQTTFAVQLLVLYFVVLILRQMLQPKILGDSIGIHPLLMLVAIYSGIVLFGVQGIIAGPVLVIIGKALWNSGLLPLPAWTREDGASPGSASAASPPAARTAGGDGSSQ